jgi:quercetin dioxygenase-like cupin family protein
MSQQLMRTRQQSTPGAQWAVAAGQALRLHVGPGERELHVTDGRLWLTREGTAHSPSEDIWLQAGDSLSLDSGSQWVAEGWGEARFQLLVPPRACAGLRFFVAGWVLRARSAASMARRAHGSISMGDSMASSGAVQ